MINIQTLKYWSIAVNEELPTDAELQHLIDHYDFDLDASDGFEVLIDEVKKKMKTTSKIKEGSCEKCTPMVDANWTSCKCTKCGKDYKQTKNHYLQTNRYPNGYFPKIQYWNSQLTIAIEAKDLAKIANCIEKIKYFTKAQLKSDFPTVGFQSPLTPIS